MIEVTALVPLTPQNWEKEFDRRTDSTNYESAESNYHSLKKGTDTLLDESWYPESAYELDPDKIKSFIHSLLAQQREAVEKLKLAQTKNETDVDWFFGRGYNRALDDVLKVLN